MALALAVPPSLSPPTAAPALTIPGAQSPNFGFRAAHDPLLVRLGAMAEFHATQDPNTAIIKVRQFAEALLPRASTRIGAAAGLRATTSS